MSEKKFYVDAEEFKKNILSALPYIQTSYAPDDISRAIDAAVSQKLQVALSSLVSCISSAIEASKKPYSQCMLCTRKDHDILPPDIR